MVQNAGSVLKKQTKQQARKIRDSGHLPTF